MAISLADVKKVARLARLKFNDNELQNLQHQLSNIMDMIDTIQEVDCSDVEPLTSICEMNLRMRKDEEKIDTDVEQLFANAPGSDSALAKEIKCFIVPKVVE